jgi:hypothetical protein
MARTLKNSPQIWKLAADLGIDPESDPVVAILRFCNKKVQRIAREFKCTTLDHLLTAVAGALGTTFIEVQSDNDLLELQRKYLSSEERAFATLTTDLTSDVLAITYKLLNKKKWQRPYVSVIDCRGEKKSRAYYSKWHELAHLLTLTDQMRLSFARTHAQTGQARDPEEALMEVIAGRFGFWQEMLGPHVQGEISFERVETLRAQHCPEASSQASLIGFANAWPSPCILLYAGLGLKKRQSDALPQTTFGFSPAPSPELRALKVQSNEIARESGLTIFPNIRVPSRSVIYKVFAGEAIKADAVENLAWWTTSDGTTLPARRVRVMARRSGAGVQALVIPEQPLQ